MTATRTQAGPLSILVVDDYPDAAVSLALLLCYAGHSARAALSGTEAIAAAATLLPDVVVLEPRTPGGDWDLAGHLGGPADDQQPLLVALTTDTTPAGRRAARAAGAGLYLVKPADPALLLAFLRRCSPRKAGDHGRPGSPARLAPGRRAAELSLAGELA